MVIEAEKDQSDGECRGAGLYATSKNLQQNVAEVVGVHRSDRLACRDDANRRFAAQDDATDLFAQTAADAVLGRDDRRQKAAGLVADGALAQRAGGVALAADSAPLVVEPRLARVAAEIAQQALLVRACLALNDRHRSSSSSTEAMRTAARSLVRIGCSAWVGQTWVHSMQRLQAAFDASTYGV